MTAGLRILEGPTIAGVGVDDVVVVDEGEVFSVALTPRGIDLTQAPRVPVAHAVLLRFVDGGWREEGGGEVRAVAGEVVVDAWRFGLIDDVAVVDTVRRDRPERVTLVRPRRVFFDGRRNVSWWTALHDDGRVQDAIVGDDGRRLVPQTSGVPLDQLSRHGVIDDGVARAIVQQPVNGRAVVCFDGVVRALDPRGKSEDRRMQFAALVGMDKSDVAAVADRYLRARAATVVEVAAFVRSFDAAGYARHLALSEELELWRLADERQRAVADASRDQSDDG